MDSGESSRKEKHFLVTKVIDPELPKHKIEFVEVEAVSRRIHGLEQHVTFRECVEVAHLHDFTDARDVVISRDGDVASGLPTILAEHTDLDTTLLIHLRQIIRCVTLVG